MIQELFGGGLPGEKRISSFPYSSSSSPTCHATSSPLLTTATTTTTTATSSTPMVNSPNSRTHSNNNNSSNSSENNNNGGSQNLRCPRCDSTNTKFCYYNNYNLTQPRHFCKTCRRYWTKGGTLRNVPIGGGCRKNKSTISSNGSSSHLLSKSSTNVMAKAKATLSSEMLANENNSLFLGNGLLDHPLQPTGHGQILWSSLPQAQNSHILALLRGSTPFSNPNPNPTPNTSSVFTNLGLDSYGNGAPSLLGSFTRSNHVQHLNGFTQEYGHNNGDNHNSGASTTDNSNILDLYQRLKSSSNYGNYCGNENQGAVMLGNMVGSTAPSSSSSSAVLEATPIGAAGGNNFEGYGFMSTSPAMSSWSEFPAVSINASFS